MSGAKKVLVVDDDRTIHILLKAALEKAGYQVFPALDAVQGVMMAKQLRPDLVILDIMMPAGGGFVVYDRLQMMVGSFQVPFIIYSSAERSEILKKIPEGPQVVVLSKTASLPELLSAAARLTA
ncbi:MAG TPA: response regulator [Elusimicrobiales bacterium]|nr:response regulator [Elusimicrobiales bacterium]